MAGPERDPHQDEVSEHAATKPRAMTRLWRHYGGGPGQLLVSILSLLIAAAGVVGWFQSPSDVERVLIWFIAAILLHDLALVPLYSLAHKVSLGLLPRSTTVYLQAPIVISLLILATVYPTVLGLGARTAYNVSAIHEHGYLERYLLLCASLFAVSALAFAMRRVGPVASGR